MNADNAKRIWCCAAAAFFVAMVVLAPAALRAQKPDAKAQKKPLRAAAPKWDKQVTDVIFFKDVFKEALAGARPPDLGKPPAAVAATPSTGNAPAGTDSGSGAASGAGWSKLVANTTLEDQIKAIKQSLDKDITSPSEFAGKGYSIARREFSALAVLFGVIAEYDGDVRWKSSAAAARDRFSALAGTAKVGSQQAYNAAKDGRTQLEDLLSGGSFPKGEGEAAADWTKVADRGPIMQNLGMSFDEKLAKWTANDSEFKANTDAALAEAQMIAIYAVLLGKEGMEDADGDSYKDFLTKLKAATAEAVDATKSGDADRARKAAGEIKKSCDGCHGEYR